jgi:hypothetical protein
MLCYGMNESNITISSIKNVLVRLSEVASIDTGMADKRRRNVNKYYNDINEFFGLMIPIIEGDAGSRLFAYLSILYLSRRGFPISAKIIPNFKVISKQLNVAAIAPYQSLLDNDGAISSFETLVRKDVTEGEILIFRLSH